MFYKLPNKSTIAEELLRFALSAEGWVKYYNFDAIQVPFPLVYTDPTLRAIGDKHSLAVGILRLDPFTTYDWHTDTNRGVSINMLLNNAPSHCIFSVEKDEATNKFVELTYEGGSYYLLNNQVPHMVLNFDTPRYMMTVEFEEGKDQLNFDMLRKELV